MVELTSLPLVIVLRIKVLLYIGEE
jgi:hypothetical protein